MGRQRESVAKMERRDECLRGSHRPAAVGGRDKCRDQCRRVEQRKHEASQAVKDCAVVFRRDRGGCLFKRIHRRTMRGCS